MKNHIKLSFNPTKKNTITKSKITFNKLKLDNYLFIAKFRSCLITLTDSTANPTPTWRKFLPDKKNSGERGEEPVIYRSICLA